MNTIKAILSILFLVISCAPSKAQDVSRSKIEGNLYYRALVSVLSAREQDSRYAHANDPLRHVLIEKNLDLNDGFPNRFGDVEVEFVSVSDLRDRYRSLKHEIPVFVMRPIVNDGDRLVVGFTRYWFTATKRTNNFALEGGYRVVFRYDPSQKDFVIDSVKMWGI